MKKGFTLIELLIVIAILGAIAVIALIAIDPLEQLARSRDAGKLSLTAQLGHALDAYAAGNAGSTANPYPAIGSGTTRWIDTLVSAGEVATVPGASGTVGCGTSGTVNNTWCYNVSGAGTAQNAVVYARLESKRNTALCANPATEVPWAVYSTADGRGGVVCTTATGVPGTGAQSFRN